MVAPHFAYVRSCSNVRQKLVWSGRFKDNSALLLINIDTALTTGVKTGRINRLTYK
jgi:hypothetical protein